MAGGCDEVYEGGSVGLEGGGGGGGRVGVGVGIWGERGEERGYES